MKIKPIDQSLAPIVEAFLNEPDLQETFAGYARDLGYTGNDNTKMKVALFTPDDDNNICFANHEIYELWLDFQILRNLSMVEPYTTLLKYYPETKPKLLTIAKRMLAGEQISPEEILSLFPEPESTEEESNV
jgi:hypothetical protein